MDGGRSVPPRTASIPSLRSAGAPSPPGVRSILDLIEPKRLLGSGSNGAVLEVRLQSRAHPSLDPETPVKRPLALKVASHFWNDAARELLECERRVLESLPPHPGVIRMYAVFEDVIPDHIRRFLPTEMSEVSSPDGVQYKTRYFLLEYHGATLDSARTLLPCPCSYMLWHRAALDLLSTAAFLHAHGAVHLDYKQDNLLVAADGRLVLADFGISLRFTVDGEEVAGPVPGTRAPRHETERRVSTGCGSRSMDLEYREPFRLLMNRAVLAPEVLYAHDTAKEAWKAWRDGLRGEEEEEEVMEEEDEEGKERKEDEDEENLVGGPEGEWRIPFGAQGSWAVGVVLYELAVVFAALPRYPHVEGAGGEGEWYNASELAPLPGHFPENARRVMAGLLHSDPSRRLTCSAALAVLADKSCWPEQVHVQRELLRASEGAQPPPRPRVRRGPTPRTRPSDEAGPVRLVVENAWGEIEVVLADGSESIASAVARVSREHARLPAGLHTSTSPTSSTISEQMRLVLGGRLLAGTESAELVLAASRAASELPKESDDSTSAMFQRTASIHALPTRAVRVLLLPGADTVATAGATWLMDLARRSHAVSHSSVHPMSLEEARPFETAHFQKETRTVKQNEDDEEHFVASPLASISRKPSSSSKLTSGPRSFPATLPPSDSLPVTEDDPSTPGDWRVLQRAFEGLTALCAAAIGDETTTFPVEEAAALAVHAATDHGHDHPEVLVAVVALLRNLSCTVHASVAEKMLELGCLVWALEAVDRVALAPASTTVPNPERVAEDGVMAASNLLRFRGISLGSRWDARRLAQTVSAALEAHPNSVALHQTATRVVRYALRLDEDRAPAELCAGGIVGGLLCSLYAHRRDQALVEAVLHGLCSLLSYEAVRSDATGCKVAETAARLVAIMVRPAYAAEEGIQGLAATALRNLACVTSDGETFPAHAITQAGAAAALESAMERLPTSTTVQENGRCALYNLLLLGSQEMTTTLEKLRKAKREAEQARHLSTSDTPNSGPRPPGSLVSRTSASPHTFGNSIAPSAARPETPVETSLYNNRGAPAPPVDVHEREKGAPGIRWGATAPRRDAPHAAPPTDIPPRGNSRQQQMPPNAVQPPAQAKPIPWTHPVIVALLILVLVLIAATIAGFAT